MNMPSKLYISELGVLREGMETCSGVRCASSIRDDLLSRSGVRTATESSESRENSFESLDDIDVYSNIS